MPPGDSESRGEKPSKQRLQSGQETWQIAGLSAQGCLSAKRRATLLHLPQGTGLGGQAPAEVESGTESQKGPERGAPGPGGCPAPWTTCALESTGPLSRLCPGAARALPQPPPSQAPHPGQRLLLLGAQVPSSAAHDALSARVQDRSARPAARPVPETQGGDWPCVLSPQNLGQTTIIPSIWLPFSPPALSASLWGRGANNLWEGMMEGQTAWPNSLVASAWVPFFSASRTPVDDARSDLCRRALPLPPRTSPRDSLGSGVLGAQKERGTRPRSQRRAEETG